MRKKREFKFTLEASATGGSLSSGGFAVALLLATALAIAFAAAGDGGVALVRARDGGGFTTKQAAKLRE